MREDGSVVVWGDKINDGTLSPNEFRSFDENGVYVVDVSSELDGTIDVIEIIPNGIKAIPLYEKMALLWLGTSKF